MAAPAKLQRESAVRRRAALLDAAAELVAEIGTGAVTHRAVAQRAGLPVSTTSYFFSSIDELVIEALRSSVPGRLAQVDATVAVVSKARASAARAVIAEAAESACSADKAPQGEQIELLLAAGRKPELRPDADATVTACIERATQQYASIGSPRAEEAGWASIALGDGAMLHRLAEVSGDQRARLEAGLRLIVAASMLDDDELEELLGRCERVEGHQ